jgi:hypothetical protein
MTYLVTGIDYDGPTVEPLLTDPPCSWPEDAGKKGVRK